MPKEKNQPASYTESELKAEILKKRAEQEKIDALKKPPSPRKAKADNYWYHYKWHTIAGAVALCLAVFFVRDMVFRTKPDATVELVASRYIAAETVMALEAALTEKAPDLNGDGKVAVSVDFIQLGESVVAPEADADAAAGAAAAGDAAAAMPMGGGEAEYASVMKFSAVLAANTDSLYLVDDAVYAYILRMGENEDGTVDPIFASQTEIPAARDDRLSVSATSLADIPGLEALGDLTFCLRVNTKNSEKDVAHYNDCVELLRTLGS